MPYGTGQYGLLDPSFGMDSLAATNPPWLANQFPLPDATGQPTDTPISFDILGESALVASSIAVQVDGNPAYDGSTGLFIAPFTGTVTPTVVGGYNGYHFEMESSADFPGSTMVVVRVTATDTADAAMDEAWRFYTATVVSSLVQGPYEITLDMWFSGQMLLSSLLDASQYTMTGGAYVRFVEPLPTGSVAPTGVRLWVEGFGDSGPFTVTVSSRIRDASGDALAPGGRTAQISPFQSSAYFSNTSGLVRSWHESRLILRDSLRAYLSDIRGMDVFDIAHGLGRPIRWSQILDAYGLGAACLLGTEDYVFSDTTPPFLTGEVPPPGAVGVSQATNIFLTVADATTAVETTALAVYVNGQLAFSGATGWSNGYGGRISVDRQGLNVQLYPPSGAVVVGLNTVAVRAFDLANNLLDTSYTFTVGAPPPSLGGFGEGSFGEAPFGE